MGKVDSIVNEQNLEIVKLSARWVNQKYKHIIGDATIAGIQGKIGEEIQTI